MFIQLMPIVVLILVSILSQMMVSPPPYSLYSRPCVHTFIYSLSSPQQTHLLLSVVADKSLNLHLRSFTTDNTVINDSLKAKDGGSQPKQPHKLLVPQLTCVCQIDTLMVYITFRIYHTEITRAVGITSTVSTFCIYHRSTGQTIKRQTENLHVDYYVSKDFKSEHKGTALHQIEKNVEEDYVSNVRNNCWKERQTSE